MPKAVFSTEDYCAAARSYLAEARVGIASFSFSEQDLTRVDDLLGQQESGSATVTSDLRNLIQHDDHRSGGEDLGRTVVTAAPEQVIQLLIREGSDSIVSQYWYADPAFNSDGDVSSAEIVALGILESVQPEKGEPQIAILYYDSAVAAEGFPSLRQAAVQTDSIPLLP